MPKKMVFEYGPPIARTAKPDDVVASEEVTKALRRLYTLGFRDAIKKVLAAIEDKNMLFGSLESGAADSIRNAVRKLRPKRM